VAYLPQSWGSPPPVHPSRDSVINLPSLSLPWGSSIRSFQSLLGDRTSQPVQRAAFPSASLPLGISPRARGDPSSGLPSLTSLRLAQPRRAFLLPLTPSSRPTSLEDSVRGFAYGPFQSGSPRELRLQSLSQSAYLLPIACGSGEEATFKQTTPISRQPKKHFTAITWLARLPREPISRASHRPRAAKNFCVCRPAYGGLLATHFVESLNIEMSLPSWKPRIGPHPSI